MNINDITQQNGSAEILTGLCKCTPLLT